VIGVARRVHESDHPAERVPEHDRLLDGEDVAEIAHGVGAELEAPVGRLAPLGAAVSRKVEVDNLRRAGEQREVRLEVGVVEAPGPAVEQDDRRPLLHRGAVGHERGPVDVEPQAPSLYIDLHRRARG
jgi:hypothetical protein